MKAQNDIHILTGYSIIKCHEVEHNLIVGQGVFGISRDIQLVDPQKVYVRIVVSSEQLTRVIVGILDGETLYEQRKTINRHKKTIISVVHKCKNDKIGIRIIFDGLGDDRTIKIHDIVFKPIGMTNVLKKTLDKIRYSASGYDNLYNDNEQKKPIVGIIRTAGIVKYPIYSSKLEEGKQYYVKVLVHEITNCGETMLDCGANTQKMCEGQIMQRFRYTKGKFPILTIKANRFLYIINVKAIMIAESENITIGDFADNNYWNNQ